MTEPCPRKYIWLNDNPWSGDGHTWCHDEDGMLHVSCFHDHREVWSEAFGHERHIESACIDSIPKLCGVEPRPYPDCCDSPLNLLAAIALMAASFIGGFLARPKTKPHHLNSESEK